MLKVHRFYNLIQHIWYINLPGEIENYITNLQIKLANLNSVLNTIQTHTSSLHTPNTISLDASPWPSLDRLVNSLSIHLTTSLSSAFAHSTSQIQYGTESVEDFLNSLTGQNLSPQTVRDLVISRFFGDRTNVRIAYSPIETFQEGDTNVDYQAFVIMPFSPQGLQLDSTEHLLTSSFLAVLLFRNGVFHRYAVYSPNPFLANILKQTLFRDYPAANDDAITQMDDYGVATDYLDTLVPLLAAADIKISLSQLSNSAIKVIVTFSIPILGVAIGTNTLTGYELISHLRPIVPGITRNGVESVHPSGGFYQLTPFSHPALILTGTGYFYPDVPTLYAPFAKYGNESWPAIVAYNRDPNFSLTSMTLSIPVFDNSFLYQFTGGTISGQWLVNPPSELSNPTFYSLWGGNNGWNVNAIVTWWNNPQIEYDGAVYSLAASATLVPYLSNHTNGFFKPWPFRHARFPSGLFVSTWYGMWLAYKHYTFSGEVYSSGVQPLKYGVLKIVDTTANDVYRGGDPRNYNVTPYAAGKIKTPLWPSIFILSLSVTFDIENTFASSSYLLLPSYGVTPVQYDGASSPNYDLTSFYAEVANTPSNLLEPYPPVVTKTLSEKASQGVWPDVPVSLQVSDSFVNLEPDGVLFFLPYRDPMAGGNDSPKLLLAAFRTVPSGVSLASMRTNGVGALPFELPHLVFNPQFSRNTYTLTLPQSILNGLDYYVIFLKYLTPLSSSQVSGYLIVTGYSLNYDNIPPTLGTFSTRISKFTLSYTASLPSQGYLGNISSASVSWVNPVSPSDTFLTLDGIWVDCGFIPAFKESDSSVTGAAYEVPIPIPSMFLVNNAGEWFDALTFASNPGISIKGGTEANPTYTPILLPPMLVWFSEDFSKFLIWVKEEGLRMKTWAEIQATYAPTAPAVLPGGPSNTSDKFLSTS